MPYTVVLSALRLVIQELGPLSWIGKSAGHGRAAPLTGSMVPIPTRAAPPMLVNIPATTTRLASGDITIAVTVAPGEGFQVSREPVVVNAAAYGRELPAAVVNAPPA